MSLAVWVAAKRRRRLVPRSLWRVAGSGRGRAGGGDFGQVGGGVDALGRAQMPSKSVPMPTWSMPAIWMMWSKWAINDSSGGRGMRAANSRSRRLAMW